MNLKNIKINKKIEKIIIEKNHTNTKYQNDILNKKTLSTTNKSTTSLFTIGSLNVRGLIDPVKLKCLSKYIQENKYLIFGISETKLNEKTVPKQKIGPYYTIWNFSNNTQAGTCIYIHDHIFKNLYKSSHLNHYISSTFFQFKPKIKLCITQIYIPHDPLEKKKVTTYLTNLIQKNLSSNILHIIMGDFNDTPKPHIDKNPPQKIKPKTKIYNTLKTNFSDTFRILHPDTKKFSHTSSQSESRIDQIWIQNQITPFLISANIINTEKEFHSDHKITHISVENFLDIQKNKKHTIYKYDDKNITSQSWDMIREKISEMQLPNSSITNKKWNFFNNKITKIKRKYCPQKKIIITNSTIFNTTCSEIHKELK